MLKAFINKEGWCSIMTMSVFQLSRAELDELKTRYFYSGSYHGRAQMPSEINDIELRLHYSNTLFKKEDFFCHAHR